MRATEHRWEVLDNAVREALKILEETNSTKAQKAAAILVKALAEQWETK